MHIATFMTKRSVREKDPHRQFKKYLTTLNLTPATVIEIIDANKKSPAYLVELEPVSNYKQAIRAGEVEFPKLRLSKTGENADGKVLGTYSQDVMLGYLKSPQDAQKSDNSFIKDFFPKRIKRSCKPVSKRTKAKSFQDISLDAYFGAEKKHHSHMHELVDNIRNYFGENSSYGPGSFSYYLGFFKKIPNHEVHRMFEESKRTNKNLEGQKKLFWWKIGQYVKQS